MSGTMKYTCSSCTEFSCYHHMDAHPANCPCRDEEIVQESVRLIQQPENRKIGYSAARVEAEGYCRKTRLEEIILFCKKMGYHNLGLAFCFGLREEARVVSRILRDAGFTVNAVVCKCGEVPKSVMGITPEQTVHGNPDETECNPIGQALLLNKAKTDFNIMLGLCVGHDTLFMKYSEAPMTVFAVKDRVLAHNPLGAVYASHYFGRRFPKEEK